MVFKKIKFQIILLVIVFFTSCTTSKKITTNEAEILKPDEDHLVLYVPNNKKYTIINYRFEEGKLIGELSKYKNRKGPKTKFYTKLNYDYNLSESEYLDFELKTSDIYKMKYKQPEPNKTKALKKGLIIGIPIVIVLGTFGFLIATVTGAF